MSITASITGLVVMLIRSIKLIPKRIAVFLWAIPFLRMLVPFGVNSQYSLMSMISRFTTKSVTVYQPAKDVVFSITNCVMAADTYFPVTYRVGLLEKVFGIASVIWICISVTILLILTVCYFTVIRDIRDAVLLHGNIYLSEKVSAPAVYGIAKPKIVLPASYRDRDIDMIILHENAHIKSRDNLLRLLAFITAAVHWFNPFSWVLLKFFLSDLEMSCDERVISKLDGEHRKKYALTLIESRKAAAVFSSGFGGAKLTGRIRNILSFKKLTVFSLISFIILIVAVFFTLLTNAS